ncbi:hypothetical protein PoB_003837100 [Plakobranchus ocellatus]|uniref:Uncharacterized protein n=1 Tax=Plakobranchus ocellatus TaxID=259542 RepID=A0AAV4AZA2_9GAST|nr:hypothetical protein PoB_003837100 [Plakobranchus ocellatus]
MGKGSQVTVIRKQKTVNEMAENKEKKQGEPEADCDSIHIKNLSVPDANRVIKESISLCAENTVSDEVRLIITNYKLHLNHKLYTFCVKDSKGISTMLEQSDYIEDVSELLSSYVQIELLHKNTQIGNESASTGEMNVELK